MENGNELFPVFLKLNQLHTLLVGGGPVGLEKLNALLTNSPHAKIKIVALEILPEIFEIASNNQNIDLHQRAFNTEDLDGVQLVMAATNSIALNQQIRLLATERRLLVNFADKPDLCDFYLGAVVKKGDLKIAVSTNGKSPTIAKRLKELLNESLPMGLDTTLQQMSALRNTLEGDFAAKVIKLNQVTSVLAKQEKKEKYKFKYKWHLLILLLAAVLVFAILK